MTDIIENIYLFIHLFILNIRAEPIILQYTDYKYYYIHNQPQE